MKDDKIGWEVSLQGPQRDIERAKVEALRVIAELLRELVLGMRLKR